MRMPPKPRYDFPRHIEPVPLPDPVKPEPDSVVKPETTPKAATRTKKPVEPVKEAAKAAVVAEPVREDKPVEKSPATPMTSYVVQVGSFSDRNNALALRDKLRKAGFPAFAEDVAAQGKTMVRIKVGPVLKRTEAEQIQKKLDKNLGIKGKIYTHR